MGMGLLTGWVIDGLVFAHEHERDALCEFSENAVRGIDVMPHAGISERSLRERERFGIRFSSCLL
jgi:hypothetical protein